MIVRNYLETDGYLHASHEGVGDVKDVRLFNAEDFDTRLRFIIYSEIPAGGSIGYHQHGQNEEVYVILGGQGVMTVNGESRPARPGDVFLNKPGWSHGLENTSSSVLKLLVFEVDGIDPEKA